MEEIQLYECKKCNVSKILKKMCKRKNRKGVVIVRPLCQSCKYEGSNKELNKKRLEKFYKKQKHPADIKKQYQRRYCEKHKDKLKTFKEVNKEAINKKAREYYYKRRFLNGFKIPEDFEFEYIDAPTMPTIS